MNDTESSRRSATTPPTAAGQSAPMHPWLGSVSAPDLAAMAAESRRLHARCRETLAEATRAEDALGASLTPEQLVLFRTSDSALGEHHSATMAWYMAEICRHLPGIAPALVAVWEHVREERGAGVCCMPDAGYEP